MLVGHLQRNLHKPKPRVHDNRRTNGKHFPKSRKILEEIIYLDHFDKRFTSRGE